MIKKLALLLCVSFGLFFISCSNDVSTTKEKDTSSADTSNEISTEANETKDTMVEKKEEPQTDNLITLIVYGANSDTYTPEILSKIQVPDNSSLKDKITSLCDELSLKKFDNLPITVTKLEKVDGKTKATINLGDDSTKTSKTWKNDYFQGTTGGVCTTVSLRETFLQKSYSGKWIDSVEFLYNGEKIQSAHTEELWNAISR